MSSTPITRLLLIEHSPEDARSLLAMLNEPGSQSTEVTSVESMDQAEKHLADHGADIVLLDLGLPQTDGLEAIRRVRAAAPGTPLVVLTGLEDESLAVRALRRQRARQRSDPEDRPKPRANDRVRFPPNPGERRQSKGAEVKPGASSSCGAR